MPDGQQVKTKGVVDIVFLLDATGSMAPCIDALKENIRVFVDSLTVSSGNNVSPVKDWRAKIVGFRDFEADKEPWLDNPFVRKVDELKDQLTRLNAEGGGDEPESLLDAIYRVAKMEQSEKGAPTEDPTKWRYRSAAARIVIVFTDASYKEKMAIPEAKGGTIDDVFNAIQEHRIILSIFAPAMPCYDKLSEVDKSEYMAIAVGPEGPQKALAAFTADQANFKETLRQLAASVSKSAETPLL